MPHSQDEQGITAQLARRAHERRPSPTSEVPWLTAIRVPAPPRPCRTRISVPRGPMTQPASGRYAQLFIVTVYIYARLSDASTTTVSMHAVWVSCTCRFGLCDSSGQWTPLTCMAWGLRVICESIGSFSARTISISSFTFLHCSHNSATTSEEWIERWVSCAPQHGAKTPTGVEL